MGSGRCKGGWVGGVRNDRLYTLAAAVGIFNGETGGGTLGAAVGGTLGAAAGETLGEAVWLTLGARVGVGSLVGTNLASVADVGT